MKRLNVTVNGVTYDVVVEEVTADAATAAAPVAAPAPQASQPAPKAAAPKATAPAGAVAVKAPMPGNIIKINFKVGDKVKRGDVLCILEAMKMENDICAPQDGVVASVNVAQGASVVTDELIVTIN